MPNDMIVTNSDLLEITVGDYSGTSGVYVDNVDRIISLTGEVGKIYSGVDPIYVNNDENKISADTWTFSAGSGISLVDDGENKVTTISVTAHGGDIEVETLVKNNSASWNDVSSKLDTTAFSTVSGNFLQANDITGKQDTLTFAYTSGNEISSINNSALYSAPFTGLFQAKYGVTPYSAVKDAVDNQKIVYCSSGARYAFMCYSGADNYEFQYYRSVGTHSTAQQGDQVFVYKVTTANNWTVTTREAYSKISAGAGLSSTYGTNTLTLGLAATSVNHDSNLSGDGTTGSPLGLSNEINIIGWGDSATLKRYGMTFNSDTYSGEYGQYATMYYASSGKEAMTASVGTVRLLDERIYADKQDLIIRPYDIDIHRGDYQSNLQASSFSTWQNNGGAEMLTFDLSSVMLSSRSDGTAKLQKDKLTFTDPIGVERAYGTYTPYGISYVYPLIDETITATVGSTGMVCYFSNGEFKGQYAGYGAYVSALSGGLISANASTGNVFGLAVAKDGSTAKITNSAFQIKDSSQTATITAPVWNSLTAWATAQGWVSP